MVRGLLSRRWHIHPEVIVDIQPDMIRAGFLYFPEEVSRANIIAVDKVGSTIVATGQTASLLRGRISSNFYQLVRPIQNGRIVSSNMLKYLIGATLEDLIRKRLFLQREPDIFVLSSVADFDIERAAFGQTISSLTSRRIRFVSGLVTTALAGGAIIPGDEVFIVKFDYDQIQFGYILKSGEVQKITKTDFGVSKIIESLDKWLRRVYDIEIGVNDLETMLWRTLSLTNTHSKRILNLTGRSTRTGGPMTTRVELAVANQFLASQCQDKLVRPVVRYIEDLPEHVREVALSRGIYTSGSLTKINGFDKWLRSQLGVYIHRVTEPDRADIEGARLLLAQDRTIWQKYVTQ